MLSSRRVKKGPGRRPLSAKRQRFLQLRQQGWSIRAAAREAGVSRASGNRWPTGYKTYRRGQVTGFVPALDPRVMRQISARFLSQDERVEIADLRRAGCGIRQIAGRLGRAPSTISRELRRNATQTGGYRPFEAHRRATARRARDHCELGDGLIQGSGMATNLDGQLSWQRVFAVRHPAGEGPNVDKAEARNAIKMKFPTLLG